MNGEEINESMRCRHWNHISLFSLDISLCPSMIRTLPIYMYVENQPMHMYYLHWLMLCRCIYAVRVVADMHVRCTTDTRTGRRHTQVRKNSELLNEKFCFNIYRSRFIGSAHSDFSIHSDWSHASNIINIDTVII